MLATSTVSTVRTTVRTTVRPTVQATPSKAVLAYRRKMFLSSLKEASIAGIPCLIEVDTCNVVKGSYSYNAASDVDYYGETCVEFTVYDRKGYVANWLEKKMSNTDREAIEEMILSSYEEESDYDSSGFSAKYYK